MPCAVHSKASIFAPDNVGSANQLVALLTKDIHKAHTASRVCPQIPD